jgi:hypothetical protein
MKLSDEARRWGAAIGAEEGHILLRLADENEALRERIARALEILDPASNPQPTWVAAERALAWLSMIHQPAEASS